MNPNIDSHVPTLGPRPADGHKGTFGKVLIVAGSWRFPGAAVLAARGALRTGAGLVCVAVPDILHPTLAGAVPAATWQPLASVADAGLAREAQGALLDACDRNDAVALGMGLGTHEETSALLEAVLPNIAKALVLDADGLNLLAGHPQDLTRRSSPTIITPHPGELQRLTGRRLPRGDGERFEAAATLARELGIIVLLKGHRTVIHDGRHGVVNATGNPGMATGGSGDVLSGIIVALLVQGLSPFDAARAGAYIHGLAGDLAAADLGPLALTAEEIIRYLPRALQQWVTDSPC